ncbi:MAG TPA: DUF4266 domain-containing protein [Kofleriaceae bacterium]|nr:DUF4266 domain-containing protein [Kofleriaceae bacterium]
MRIAKLFIAGSILGLIAVSAQGCARVKPYEREYLARPSMSANEDPGRARFAHHARGSREGAAGGTGKAGGGCGCN